MSDPGVIPVKFRAPGGTVAELVPIGRYKNAAAAGKHPDKIVHLSLKVDDVKNTGDFYEQVFGFRMPRRSKTRDHLSRHMTDGEIDFTLMKYDAGTTSKESKAAGDGPCIHHFAIEVPDIERPRESDQALRLRDRERPGRDPGEVPRAGRHRRGAGSRGTLQAQGRVMKPFVRSGDFWSGLALAALGAYIVSQARALGLHDRGRPGRRILPHLVRRRHGRAVARARGRAR